LPEGRRSVEPNDRVRSAPARPETGVVDFFDGVDGL
jgi:hypothetical protein